jgi:hypothetical protein
MSVLNPRTRLISFRVSEHEYARLRALSNSQGAHSLADFVRASLCSIMENAHHGLGARTEAGFPGLLFGELASQKAPMATAADQTLMTLETLAGLLRALQWKAESLDQEVRQLNKLLRTLEPARGGSIPQGSQQVASVTVGPVAELHKTVATISG